MGLSCSIHLERPLELVRFINMTLNLNPAQAKASAFSLPGQAFVFCASEFMTLCEKIPTASSVLGF